MEHRNNVTGVNFLITSSKHVSVISLFINNNIKYLENLKQGFKRTI